MSSTRRALSCATLLWAVPAMLQPGRCARLCMHIAEALLAVLTIRAPAQIPYLRLQGQAETYLEKLHSMVEKELKDLQRLMEDPSQHAAGEEATKKINNPEWQQFRQTLIGLTDVTRLHFNKLVEVRLLQTLPLSLYTLLVLCLGHTAAADTCQAAAITLAVCSA